MSDSVRAPGNIDISPAVIARELRQSIGLRDEQYADLAAISALWPGLTFADVDIDKSGYLLNYGHEGEILVRRRDPVTRQRFTWAHELGHWMLASSCDSHPVQSGDRPGGAAIERWCDQFAANLLVPESFVRALDLKRPTEPLRAAVEIHRQFRVSIDVSLASVSSVTGSTMFRVRGGRVKSIHVYGSRKLAPRVRERLQQLALPDGDDVHTVQIDATNVFCMQYANADVIGSVEQVPQTNSTQVFDSHNAI